MRLLLLLCTALLGLLLLWAPAPAYASVPVDGGGIGADPPNSMDGVMQDYQTVRKIGMALALIGCLIGVTKLATTESPSERHRAQNLLMLCAGVFIFLAGDRMIVRGIVIGWFHLDADVLPAFWQ